MKSEHSSENLLRGLVGFLFLNMQLRAIALGLVLIALSGCADRPSFVSIKKVMGKLEQRESLSQVIEVRSMQKLKTNKENNHFIVDVYFEQHFMLSLSEAAELTEKTINQRNPESALLNHELPKRREFIENILIKKYGAFQKGDLRRRYLELIFRKSGDRWHFSEERKHWKDFDPSYFPQK